MIQDEDAGPDGQYGFAMPAPDAPPYSDAQVAAMEAAAFVAGMFAPHTAAALTEVARAAVNAVTGDFLSIDHDTLARLMARQAEGAELAADLLAVMAGLNAQSER